MGKNINNATQTWRDEGAAARRARLAATASDDPRDETELQAKLRLRDNAQLDVQVAKLETEREALDKRIAFLRSQKRP